MNCTVLTGLQRSCGIDGEHGLQECIGMSGLDGTTLGKLARWKVIEVESEDDACLGGHGGTQYMVIARIAEGNGGGEG